MPLSEFDMISRYFRHLSPEREDTILAIGDDAALLAIDCEQRLLTTLLQWQEGIEYLVSEPPAQCAQRILQQAITDLQKLNGVPAWMTLSLSFQQQDEEWLSEFCKGLTPLLQQYTIQLIGGDTTRGPNTLRVQLMGLQQLS